MAAGGLVHSPGLRQWLGNWLNIFYFFFSFHFICWVMPWCHAAGTLCDSSSAPPKSPYLLCFWWGDPWVNGESWRNEIQGHWDDKTKWEEDCSVCLGSSCVKSDGCRFLSSASDSLANSHCLKWHGSVFCIYHGQVQVILSNALRVVYYMQLITWLATCP